MADFSIGFFAVMHMAYNMSTKKRTVKYYLNNSVRIIESFSW